MPVTYLAAALVAGLWLAARGMTHHDGDQSASHSLAGLAASSFANRVEPTLEPKPAGSPELDAILRTAEGLRRKVVVRELDVVPRKTPEGPASGSPLDYFAIRFVYGETPAMIQVGPRSGGPEGWVPRESVLEWDTRLMARPTPRASRSPLVIYREEPCLVAALAGRQCPRHAGRCPTEGEESSEDGPDAFLGWPILRSKSVPGTDGSPRSIFEVAPLVADRAPPAVRPERLRALQPALKHVYVAFAVDTTASMAATIDSAKSVMTGLADRVAKDYRDVTLHVALVDYRDDSPGFGFKARLVTRFTEPLGFRAYVEALASARMGDGTVDESVLDGVALALPGTPGGVDWPTGRSGELATKLLVVLGDAPDHARDLDRAKALAERARAAGISIAAVMLDRPGTLSRAEKARFEAQWRTLAEGSYRPPDQSQGFATPVAPLLIRAEGASALAPRLRALIDDRIEHARGVAALAEAEAEGRLKEYVDSRGLTLRQVAPVLVDLHRGESDPSARPDPRLNGRKAPSLRRGWVAERTSGAKAIDMAILMDRDELDTLIAELAALQQAASGSAADLADLLAIGNAAATGETSFLAADRGSQTFADHLRRRRQLPAKPGSLLERSQSDLLRADAIDRAALDARLRSALLGLTRRRNAPDWSDPRRTVEGMATVPYDLIDF
jgi:hypothetical protein